MPHLPVGGRPRAAAVPTHAGQRQPRLARTGTAELCGTRRRRTALPRRRARPLRGRAARIRLASARPGARQCRGTYTRRGLREFLSAFRHHRPLLLAFYLLATLYQLTSPVTCVETGPGTS